MNCYCDVQAVLDDKKTGEQTHFLRGLPDTTLYSHRQPWKNTTSTIVKDDENTQLLTYAVQCTHTCDLTCCRGPPFCITFVAHRRSLHSQYRACSSHTHTGTTLHHRRVECCLHILVLLFQNDSFPLFLPGRGWLERFRAPALAPQIVGGAGVARLRPLYCSSEYSPRLFSFPYDVLLTQLAVQCGPTHTVSCRVKEASTAPIKMLRLIGTQ
ncbi:uncharacterized protein HMPREF1120_01386 [Exophiala dermatitidis NIH/UT8656]|uniref:Uncharacterized protein n=1 Tax=Exophiala dermatitidis (strain ATCC 34100 / CBS 525.76 / NIH/UT8656) TaxID=858893 RepID=H6BNK3_EXODN|nr:uncharacterized protein HMPREF1120_01386 [Exophiala dermatitidis NIH/UT8656]EHY53188.1 hypothetical protein HMPREF1120_01386 [Exophiala dermatitidis NIH/UT8656]